MKALILPLLLIFAQPVAAQECVVLLHGLARTSLSMEILGVRLARKGYHVVNQEYPSTDAEIRVLAHNTLPKAIADCDAAKPVNFVTHSMGGLLVRQYLKDVRVQDLGRVVMLGPPNKGSPLVDEFMDVPGFELWNGIAGTQMGTGENSVPNQLGPVAFPLGVIAGTQSILPMFSGEFDGPHDGKVSVESTKVDGMADHITMKVTHTFMMNNPLVHDQVLAFLKTGRFQR